MIKKYTMIFVKKSWLEIHSLFCYKNSLIFFAWNSKKKYIDKYTAKTTDIAPKNHAPQKFILNL